MPDYGPFWFCYRQTDQPTDWLTDIPTSRFACKWQKMVNWKHLPWLPSPGKQRRGAQRVHGKLLQQWKPERLWQLTRWGIWKVMVKPTITGNMNESDFWTNLKLGGFVLLQMCHFKLPDAWIGVQCRMSRRRPSIPILPEGAGIPQVWRWWCGNWDSYKI